jgi:hypothetical protein
MLSSEVHIKRSPDDRWTVSKGGEQSTVLEFAKRDYAVAFGRALAFTNGWPMFIYGNDGIAKLQSRASLTYPTRLE